MSPLHHVGNFLRELMLEVPLPVVRGLFLALPVVLLVWVLTLPRRTTTPPKATGSAAENLKVWAVLALLIQIVIYSLL